MRGWAVAVRVARREALRAKGRSALVLAMILLPVLALTFVAVTYDMFKLTADEELDRRLGRFDAELRWTANGPVRQSLDGELSSPVSNASSPANRDEHTEPTVDELLRLLPSGTRAVPVTEDGTVDLRVPAGAVEIAARHLDVGDPAYAGVVKLIRGHAPANDGEVALTEAAAARLGVTVGGTVTLADGKQRYTVAGLVEFPAALRPIAVFRPDAGATTTWLVDTPEPLAWPAVKRLNEHGVVAYSRAVLRDPPPPGELYAFGSSGGDGSEFEAAALVLGLGVLEVVLLAGPAFAVGARRRRRDLALVAANGGTPAQLRRIVLADGLVLGVAGAVPGVLAGIAVAFAARPWLEDLVVEHRAGGYRVFPLALAGVAAVAVVTGLLAAVVPAFMAARQDVIASLAGRRGVTRSRKRWVALGLAMIGGGAALTAGGAWSVDSTAVTAGLVVGELGLVLCTPALIGLVARAGRVLPLASRIALRDTARNRTAAAPAISAVMAAVAGSIALAVQVGGDTARTNAMYTPNLPAGYATLTQDPVAAGNQPEPVPTDQLDRAARQVLPVSGTAAVSTTACPAGLDAVTCTLWPDLPKEQLCPYEYGQNPPAELRERLLHDPRCDVGGPWVTTTSLNGVVDDGAALALLTAASGDDLARAAQTLRDGGVVVADPRMVKDGTVTLTAFTGRKSGESDERKVTVAGYALAHPISRDLVVLSPGAVTRAGYRTAPLGIVIATSRVPTDAERGAFRAAAGALGAGYFGAVERPLELNEDLTLLVLSIAAGVIALGAAAIATGLAAVDGRGDLATLAAVGASPGLRRRLSLSQSGVIAGLGSLLGAGAGLGAGLAVLAAYNRALGQNWPPELPYPIAVPWSSLLIAVLVVPAAAMLGAGLLTRSRLPIERRL